MPVPFNGALRVLGRGGVHHPATARSSSLLNYKQLEGTDRGGSKRPPRRPRGCSRLARYRDPPRLSHPAGSCRTTWRHPPPARTAGQEEASATLSLPVCAATTPRGVPAAGDGRSAETQVAGGQVGRPGGAPVGQSRRPRQWPGGKGRGCCAHPGGGSRRQVPRLRRPEGPRPVRPGPRRLPPARSPRGRHPGPPPGKA